MGSHVARDSVFLDLLLGKNIYALVVVENLSFLSDLDIRGGVCSLLDVVQLCRQCLEQAVACSAEEVLSLVSV